ncbi:MAG TPA: hypothetical protein VG096_01945 [Bryobacteraceae bacterium]|jgi:hypothetical protein|nr:hypothetical protein [Bryobacteraceae bacterium]
MPLNSQGWLLISALAGVTAAPAQWLHYPTAGVPRLPNGKPNLSARAPRTADGKPDLSGIWQLEAACPPEGCGDYPGGPEFANMGAKLKGGLPYQPWTAELVKKRSADLGKDDPVARCQPAGALRLLTFPPPRKILQLPGLVVILSERDVTFRQIFTDGRPLPDDPTPNWNGYSAGKWEGDTLVAKTIGFRDGTWLDRNGSPLTEAGQVTERFRRVSYGRLEIAVTVDDPKAYTKPWTVTLNQRILLDTELLDYFCQDNEKDAVHAVGK